MSILLVLLTLTLNTGVLSAASSSPTDIANHWARSAILQAIQSGYVSGYADGSFKPNKTVTRAEFITMLLRAQKVAPIDTDTPFVDDKGWYRPYIAAALKSSLIKMGDYSGGKFEPDRPITRGEIAKMAVRAAGKDKEGKKLGYVYISKQLGLLKPDSKGNVGIARKSTRAEAVVINERLLLWQKAESVPVEPVKFVDVHEINQFIKGLDSFSGTTMISGKTLMINPKGVEKASAYKLAIEYNSSGFTQITVFENPSLHKELLLEILASYYPQKSESVYAGVTKVFKNKNVEAALTERYDERKTIITKVNVGKSISIKIF